jgi:molybdopterin/thiamine biosynthesis adenylyltransferase
MSLAEHELNALAQFLRTKKIEVRVNLEDACISCFITKGEIHFGLRVEFDDAFPSSLPKFYLLNRDNYGLLAHVGWGKSNYAPVCIGENDAFSLNIDNPQLVLLDSLKLAVSEVTKSLTDPAYNHAELMKEFGGVWRFHTNLFSKIICIAEPLAGYQELGVKTQSEKKDGVHIANFFIAKANSNKVNDENYFDCEWVNKKRNNQGKGIAIHIPPDCLILPPAPNEPIGCWWKNQLRVLPEFLRRSLRKYARRAKATECFLLLNTKVNSQPLWFCIRCLRNKKEKLPLHDNYIEGWEYSALVVEPISRNSLLYRSGANEGITDAHICLIGCGSVGGHIADMLASNGVGKLTLHDPDVLKPENLHRHNLSSNAMYLQKTTALKAQLKYKYPFLQVDADFKRLLSLKNKDLMRSFDLIILATGNVSQEKVFSEWLFTEGINTPILSTWVEALGVGGHALMAKPGTNGCLSCTYISNIDGQPSLDCNINFVEAGQYVMQNYAGCGTEFLPYSNLDSVQTATIATRLATKALTEDVFSGSVVSWHGDDTLAKSKDVELSHRFHNIPKSMKTLPIFKTECEICK